MFVVAPFAAELTRWVGPHVTPVARAVIMATLSRVLGAASSTAAHPAAAAFCTQVVDGIANPNETAVVSLFWTSAASCAIAAALVAPLPLWRSLLLRSGSAEPGQTQDLASASASPSGPDSTADRISSISI